MQRVAYIEDFGLPTQAVRFSAESYPALLKQVRRKIVNVELTLCVEIDGRWIDWDKTEPDR